MWKVFFTGAVFPVRCEAARLLAGVRDFSGAENRACWVFFFRSRKSAAAIFFVAAEQPYLYADWVRSSSIYFLI